MIRDKLKKDLIKYIKYLTDTTDNLEDMYYEDLLAIYVSVMGLDYQVVKQMIIETIEDFRKNHPEELIDDDQIIDDTGILDPINYLHLMRAKLRELTSELDTRKSHLEMYSGFLKDDLKIDLDDESIKPEQKTELLNDISYEKKVVASYPGIIAELEDKTNKLAYAVSKMDNYHLGYDSDSLKF